MVAKRTRLRFEPLEPRHLLSGLAGVGAESTVFAHIPDNLTGQPGQQVLAPVNIDNAAGIRGAEIRINYDTTLLDADNASVSAGSVWPAGSTELVVNVDAATGSIVAFVFTAEGVNPGSGSLLTVQFTISGAATVGNSTAIDLAQVRLNEGAIVPDPQPVPGPDPTDGRITFVAPGDTASVSGYVYADTNNNHQPDLHEGVPRVTIALVGTDNGQQRETFTEDNGRYEFRDLPAGSYLVREQQPKALLDGGPNEISASLSSGQALTGQNFRERGLGPAYVYNRLFTTAALPVGSANWVSAVRHIVVVGGSTAAALQSASAQPAAAVSDAAAVATVQAASTAMSQEPATTVVEQAVVAEPPAAARAAVATQLDAVEPPSPAVTEPAPSIVGVSSEEPPAQALALAETERADVESAVFEEDGRCEPRDLALLAATYFEGSSPKSKRLESIDLAFAIPDPWLSE